MASRYGYSTRNGSAVYRSLRLRRTALLTAVTITATNTAEELREECRSVVAELKDVVDGVAMVLVNNENVLKHGGQQGGERGDAATYADSV